MSYVRSYSGTVTVSGSRTVSYPASQYGGSVTVNYTETVPVSFDVTVDTSSFDGSVDNARKHVDGLTGAVAAMNAAQCLAAKENSQKISKSLIDGFYGLISSDISLKKSECNSELQSKIALLLELAKDVDNKHERMQGDLDRLHAHYGAIFKGLDEDLYKRIRELDKPVFLLDEKAREEVVLHPYRSFGASAEDGMSGGNRTLGMIVSARLRNSISGVLSNIGRFLGKTVSYKKTMDDVLWNETPENEREEYVPAVYLVSQGLGQPQEEDRCYTVPFGETERMSASVREYIGNNKNTKKDIGEEEMKLIDQAFFSLVEEQSRGAKLQNDEHGERVFAMMMQMWRRDKQNVGQL